MFGPEQVAHGLPYIELRSVPAQVAFIEDTREQYSDMREEFFASLEDRRYLTISDARKKGLKVGFVLNPGL